MDNPKPDHPPVGAGRGAAVLAALRARQKKPENELDPDNQEGSANTAETVAQSASPNSDEVIQPRLPPAGRAALLSSIVGKKTKASDVLTTSATHPSVGRAAILERLKIKGVEAGVVGASSVSTSIGPPKGRAQLLASLRSGSSIVESSSSQSQAGHTSPESVGTRTQSPSRDISPPPKQSVSPTALASVSPISKSMSQIALTEETDNAPIIRKGTAGKTVKMTANYVRLEVDGDKGLHEYEVKFDPVVDSRDDRFKLVGQQKELFGPTKTFDGVCLFLPHQLPEIVTVVKCRHPVDQSEVKLTISLKHKKRFGDKQCIQFYNILFRRVMQTLKMCQMNKNYYDPTLGHMIPQHKLEIWPGYVTAVQEFEGGIMLCCDVSHKVLRTQTAYDLMKDVFAQKPADIQGSVLKALLGSIVLTRYNNKCYKIDDIDWSMTPNSTFINHNGVEQSFVDYYKKNYNLTINDVKQPMLINRAKKKTVEESDVAKLIALVPELCNLTGLTEHMKNDFKVMKDVAQFTRVTPHQRQQVLNLIEAFLFKH